MLLDTSCRDEYNIFSEEDRDFTLGWASLENMTTERADWTRLETAFHFQGFLDLQNILYAGTINTYGGGGYVADLGNSSQAALFLLNHLLSNNWVDRFTRAVFFEMTLYNANINGFAFVVCMFEFSPTGGVFPRIKVDIFNVYSGLGVAGTAVLACIVIWVLILIYLIVHEAFKMRKNAKRLLEHTSGISWRSSSSCLPSLLLECMDQRKPMAVTLPVKFTKTKVSIQSHIKYDMVDSPSLPSPSLALFPTPLPPPLPQVTKLTT